jgi:hypothetical protein
MAITRSATDLELIANVPELDEVRLRELAEGAEKTVRFQSF